MTCSLCDKPVYARGWCSMHHRRWRDHGDPEHETPNWRIGENNHGWQGDKVSYRGAHDRVRRSKGRPSQHPCHDCGKTAQDWSYNGGDPEELVGLVESGPRKDGTRGTCNASYSPNTEYYVPRCRRCHNLHDQA